MPPNYPLLKDPTSWMEHSLDTKFLLRGQLGQFIKPGDTEVTFFFPDLDNMPILITDPGGLPDTFGKTPTPCQRVEVITTVTDNGLEASTKDFTFYFSMESSV